MSATGTQLYDVRFTDDHSRDRYRRSAVWRKLRELTPAFTLGTIKHITHQHFSFVLNVKGDNLKSFL